MRNDKQIAEWMDQLRTELREKLAEELTKLDFGPLVAVLDKLSQHPAGPGETAGESARGAAPRPVHRTPSTCSVDGCSRPARARGLCALHFAKDRHSTKRLTGRAASLAVQPPAPPRPIAPPARTILRHRRAETASPAEGLDG